MKRNDDPNDMLCRAALLALAGLLPFGAGAEEPGRQTVDTSQWHCEYCVFEEGFRGEIEAGLGVVAEDSYKFGEYNGLQDQGGYLIGHARGTYRERDGDYYTFTADDLGLDTRSVSLEGGRQGRFTLSLDYHELPHFISDRASTPFLGSGGETLSLPAGWSPAGTTATMADLDASLHPVNLETDRTRLGVGVEFVPASRWEYAANFRRDTKEGRIGFAGSFFFDTARLVAPVDYVTDQVDVSASYVARKWQATLAYYGSSFRNDKPSLTWSNPYTPIVAGADTGQFALAPDNQFHQLTLSLGFEPGERTRASGEIAVGRMEQDERFLAQTLNASLNPAPLPRDSLDGEVNTLNAQFRVVSSVTDRLRLKAAATYDERDNDTPQADFVWVTTDGFVNQARANLPYSFTRTGVELTGDYRHSAMVNLDGGYDFDRHERTFQEVDETREHTVWGRVKVYPAEVTDLSVKLSRGERDASDYQTVSAIDPPENPLLRKYNMADRTRNALQAEFHYRGYERVHLGVGLDYADDDYTDSRVGLTNSKTVTLNADAAVTLSERTYAHIYASHDRIDSDQAGSQSLAAPDWFAENEDRVNTVGVGIQHRALDGRLDLGADYVLSRSTGDISVTGAAPGVAFPELNTRLGSLKLNATYRLRDDLDLQAVYWYERYRADDWTLDGVEADTVPNVISFAEDPPEYDVHAVMLSVRYRFR